MFNKMKKLREAIRRNDATQIKTINNRDKYEEACTLAVASDAPDALRVLLEKGGFDFAWGFDEHRRVARKLIDAAFSSSNPPPLLSVLYAKNKIIGYRKLDASNFLAKSTPVELIQDILNEDPAFFKYCINNVGLVSTDKQKLAAILDFTSKAPDTQPTLDQALVSVAKTGGDIEKAKLLLEHNANPNFDNGKALLHACESGHQDMVDLLLPHTKPAICSSIAPLLQISEYNVPQAIISSIEAAAAPQKAPVAQQPQKAADGLKAIDADTLEETKTLSDGSRLTTTFNFHAETAVIVHARDHAASGVSLERLDKFSPDYIAGLRKIHAALNDDKKARRFRTRPLSL